MFLPDLLEWPSKQIKYGLDRTHRLLFYCHSPEKNFLKIQIIGTNGKGSVAAFLTQILCDAGYKVGTYTSPHLLKINERITVNQKHIETGEMKEFISKNNQGIETIKPSFFETMTVMAMWYFNKKKIDIGILETGLGGRLDSVTACKSEILLFTAISMDHHDILGNSLKKIAFEKAQAIQKSKQIIISVQQTKQTKIILQQQAKALNNKIEIIDPNDYIDFQLKYLFGEHQVENANLAYYAIQKLNKHKTIKISSKNSTDSICKTAWHGRFQIISKKPTVIYDVAHNCLSLESFLKAFIQYSKNRFHNTKYLICAFEYNKKIITTLKKLGKHFDTIICTETNIRKSMPINQLAKPFKNNLKIILIKDAYVAINHIKEKAKQEDIIAIIGSHFIAPAINRFFKNCFVHNK